MELRLVRAVLDGRVVDDERQLGVVEGRLLDVGGVGQVAQRRRLCGVALVHAEDLHPQLFRLLVERVAQLLVVELEAVARLAGIGVAVPLPGVDAVDLDLALHLLESAGRSGELVVRFQ